MAFQKPAGGAADAVDKAQPMLLEPVDEVTVLIPDDYVGAVMSDLSSRRGRVLGTEPVGVGRTLVKARSRNCRSPGTPSTCVGIARHGIVHPAVPAPRASPGQPGRQGRGGLPPGVGSLGHQLVWLWCGSVQGAVLRVRGPDVAVLREPGWAARLPPAAPARGRLQPQPHISYTATPAIGLGTKTGTRDCTGLAGLAR